MTRPHPKIMAAKGLTRYGLDWLNGDGPYPIVVPDPKAVYADTLCYWETVHDTGINPARAWQAFDRLAATYRLPTDVSDPTFLGSTS